MEYGAHERYLLWLSFVTECYPARYYGLLDTYKGGAEEVFQAAATNKLDVCAHCGAAHIKNICEKASEGYIDRCLEYMRKKHIDAVSFGSIGYPILLSEISDPPPVLFVRGMIKMNIQMPIAVIGSRKCTDYGKRTAELLSRELSERGACIISGLAYGIDCIASKSALDAKDNEYPTVAVLGSGVDVIYPKSNARLYSAIVERGAVISEFLPGAQPERYNFPRRNRIISGISRGVVVVEAAKTSGTSITVGHALDQGRDVFAVPGRINDQMSEGTNALIAQGHAKCVLCTQDIIDEYGGEFKRKDAAMRIDETVLNYEQTLLIRLLTAGERSFDELCELTGLSAAKLNSTLTGMEFSGIIKQSPGRMYEL
ncbi:MAG: DNA-processing protein DprA [Clostridia bacterium]